MTARTQDAQLARDLRPEDFEVYEDGVRQDVSHFGQEESPISVVVLVDKSASMAAGDKLMHAKDAVTNFVQALKPSDETLIIAFSDSIDALGGFGLNARTIERAVKRVETESGTRLYDAVIEAAREIAGPSRKEKRALLILSDGEDTESVAGLDKAVEAVRLAEVPVYAIAIEYGYGDLSPSPPVAGGLWRQLRGAVDHPDPAASTSHRWHWRLDLPDRSREALQGDLRACRR